MTEVRYPILRYSGSFPGGGMLGRIEHKYVVALVGVFSIFMELLDTTIVNVALPTLIADFEVSEASTIQWVVTGYLISLAMFIPVSGWAGDRFGTKRVFMFALAVFSGASLACAFAWSVESLTAFRILQGVGGGMLSPVAFSMVWREFPPEERSKAAGIMVVPAAAAPATGPVIGGLLVEKASWEWIFLINVPIGALALLITLLYVREHREARPGRFDPLGFTLSASGLACVMYALSEAGPNGWTDPRVVGFGLAGLALIAAFAMVELRMKEPMLDVRLLGNRLFRACNLAWLATMFAGSSMVFLLTLELQSGRGLSPLESGLTTFTMAIGVMLTAQPASRIYRRIGPQRMIGAGMVLSAAVTIALSSLMSLDLNLWTIRGLMLVRGIGFACVLVPLQAATYAQVAPSDTGRATALYNATSQFASGLGVAVAATYLTSRLTHYGAVLGAPADRPVANDAFQDALLLMGLLALAGAAVALLIRDSDAAATMAPQRLPVEGVEQGSSAPRTAYGK
jgi:EmrB/QacA subfamily drug resistance transporter